MDKMKKNIILIFILSILQFLYAGCNNEQDLGNNYYYLPMYEAIDVGYPGGAIIYKSDTKYYYDDIKIKGNVIGINHNSDFIIVVQKPINVNKINKKIIDTFNYYVISKQTDKVYGPYNKKEYMQKRIKLGVPENLKLEVK